MNDIGLRAIKAALPDALVPIVRNCYYRLRTLRFWRNYVAGLAYTILGRRYYETPGFRYYLPSRNLLIRGKSFRDQHEVNTRAMVRKHIRADAKVLDLGACCGIVSCVINRMLTEQRNQVAVEANPEVMPVLLRNRDLNGCGFAVEHCMVSRRSSGQFLLSDDIFISSASAGEGRTITVPVYTVDDLERKHRVAFDTVFMDIQGSEHEFIKDNPDFLCRCRTVIVEMHEMLTSAEDCTESRSLLAAAGLELIDVQGRVEAWARPD